MTSGVGTERFLARMCTMTSEAVFAFPTPKIVRIQDKRIGAFHRLIQIAIIAYIVGYVLIWRKGYQETGQLESSVVSKVKGVIRINESIHLTQVGKIWDSVDMVVPPQENNAFFITTNVVVTPDQQQGRCPETASAFQDGSIGQNGIQCVIDKDCEARTMVRNGNGFRTGVCSNKTKTCEIEAWCPTEYDVRSKSPVLAGYEYFTVLIKNHIIFPKFGVRRNIIDDLNQTYLTHCTYHPTTDKFCPVFVVGDILKFAGEDSASITERGGIIGFVIEWNCNLDLSIDNCRPEFSFRRMDNKNDKIAKGWNFRYANYWTDQNGTQRRTLVKAYGIRFVFNVYGTAGKFSVMVLAIKLGAGLGLLGIARILCDFVLLNCLKNRQMFQDFKYLPVDKESFRRYSSRRASQDPDFHSAIIGDTELVIPRRRASYAGHVQRQPHQHGRQIETQTDVDQANFNRSVPLITLTVPQTNGTGT